MTTDQALKVKVDLHNVLRLHYLPGPRPRCGSVIIPENTDPATAERDLSNERYEFLAFGLD